MSENSKISWTHHTFNPWRGCTKVSDGCRFCYADTLSKRNPATLGVWGPNGSRPTASESYWRQLKAWDKTARYLNERHRVFVASLADVGEEDATMPEDARAGVHAARKRLWNEIRQRNNLDFLLLTKRPANLGRLLREEFGTELPSNLWVGTSVEDQMTADERIDRLYELPARVRFLSCEPLLGPLDLSRWVFDYRGAVRAAMNGASALNRDQAESVIMRPIDWVICGGESGSNARPMHLDWARLLRDQCKAAGVSFFFKQLGGRRNKGEALEDIPEDLRIREMPT